MLLPIVYLAILYKYYQEKRSNNASKKPKKTEISGNPSLI